MNVESFEKLNLESWKLELGSLEAWVAVRPDCNKTNEKSNSIFFIFIHFLEWDPNRLDLIRCIIIIIRGQNISIDGFQKLILCV